MRIEHNDFNGTGGINSVRTSAAPTAAPQSWFWSTWVTARPTARSRFATTAFTTWTAGSADGLGGYLPTAVSGYSSGIHTANVFGLPGMEIAWNQIINEPYRSASGDSINIYIRAGPPLVRCRCTTTTSKAVGMSTRPTATGCR